jgi:hypothetical protein
MKKCQFGTIKTKEEAVLDIAGFFFHMNTQVKAEVRSPKAVTPSTNAEKETSFVSIIMYLACTL